MQQGRRGLENETQKVAMYLVTRLCELTLAETAARFGGVSYGTVAWACHQVRTRAASDRHFQRQLQRIQSHVNQPKT